MKKYAGILSLVNVLMVVALGAPSAFANVSLKNGNFFIGYVDVVYPGGFEPKIERVYNSKASYKGIFGTGWGSEYEAYLTVSADGSVVVHEYGGGAENRFSPVAFNKVELDKAVTSIADAAKKSGIITSQSQVDQYRTKLAGDASFRNDEWQKLVKSGRLASRKLPNGSQLQSNRFAYQYITRTDSGYVRVYDTGKIQQFNEQGKLVKIQDKNGNFISLTYGKTGKLEKLMDNFNRKMFFTFNTRGLLEKIQGENNKEANYKYTPQGELAESKDVNGNKYTYKYSTDDMRNLIQIGYTDNTTMDIAYYPREKNGSVKSLRERDKTLTEYTYGSDKPDALDLKVGVVIKNSVGKVISNNQYEYQQKVKPDGERWTYKLTTNMDGEIVATIYNACCGLPLSIKRGTEETTFEYDQKGHVTKKSSPFEVTELSYHPKVGKVTKVVKYSKTDKARTNWSEFSYDDKGNLLFAKNSEGKGVKLFYDSFGRIKTMVDQNKKQISFKYNENSKPVEISDPSVGTITVQYTNSGEIKKVDSTAGRKIAVQVTSSFQNLLEIIRPAGVTLSF